MARDNESRHDCPECGSIETEQVDVRFGNLSDVVHEDRSCNDCYAGYEVTYEYDSKRVTVEAEPAEV